MTHTTYNKPNPQRILELLKEAGEEGVLGPDLARQFTVPDPTSFGRQLRGEISTPTANLQRRLAWVNQILHRMHRRGFVTRRMDRSPHYRQVPAYRWWITESGVTFLAVGMWTGVRAARVEQRRRREEERASWQRHTNDLITQAYIDYDPATVCLYERTRIIGVLRAAGCTLESIGGVFGITRERVRQIAAGEHLPMCRCLRCVDAEWFEVGDGEVVG